MNTQKERKFNFYEVLALVISPTRYSFSLKKYEKFFFDLNRELAKQIHDVAKNLVNLINQKVTLSLFIGGTNLNQYIEEWKESGGNIIVGTPGKLKELFIFSEKESILNLKNLEILVIGFLEKNYSKNINKMKQIDC